MHGFGGDLAKPDGEMRSEVFTGQFDHRDVTSAIQLQQPCTAHHCIVGIYRSGERRRKKLRNGEREVERKCNEAKVK